MPSRPRPLALSLRIAVWRWRRVLAVCALACVAWVGVRQLAPPPPATDPVVVAARNVPAGTVLGPGDLRVVLVPTALVPGGAFAEVAELTGRGTAVPLPRGLAVVAGVLAGDRFAFEPPDGTVVVPVDLSGAATRGLLQPGDRVDLVAPAIPGGYGELLEGPDADDEPQVLARGALVVDVGEAADGAALAGLGSSAEPSGTLVAVSPEEGSRLAAAGASGPLGAVLVG